MTQRNICLIEWNFQITSRSWVVMQHSLSIDRLKNVLPWSQTVSSAHPFSCRKTCQEIRNDNDYRPSEVVIIYNSVAVRMEKSCHLFLKLSKENAPCLVFNLNFLRALEYQDNCIRSSVLFHTMWFEMHRDDKQQSLSWGLFCCRMSLQYAACNGRH